MLTCAAWVLFRANSLADACYIETHFWKSTTGSPMAVAGFEHQDFFLAVAAIGVLECVQTVRQRARVMPSLGALPLPLRWCGYCGFLLFLIVFGVYQQTQFIYFQF
jgi:hypothetical protein